jgi:hypothetical protein
MVWALLGPDVQLAGDYEDDLWLMSMEDTRQSTWISPCPG